MKSSSGRLHPANAYGWIGHINTDICRCDTQMCSNKIIKNHKIILMKTKNNIYQMKKRNKK